MPLGDVCSRDCNLSSLKVKPENQVAKEIHEFFASSDLPDKG